MNETPREILDTILGYLGFAFEIKELRTDSGHTLMIYTSESDRLIGPRGETLDDLQFLVNRIAQEKQAGADRVQIDCEHYRQMREDAMLHRVRELAELVRKTGRPYNLDPMNAYDRRLVHTAFKDDPEIITWSPPDDGRIKRITLKRRTPENQG